VHFNLEYLLLVFGIFGDCLGGTYKLLVVFQFLFVEDE
jgi:hypothetical protein